MISMSDLKNTSRIFELLSVEFVPGTYAKVLISSFVSCELFSSFSWILMRFLFLSVSTCTLFLKLATCSFFPALIEIWPSQSLYARSSGNYPGQSCQVWRFCNFGFCSGGFIHSAKRSYRTPQRAHPSWTCTSQRFKGPGKVPRHLLNNMCARYVSHFDWSHCRF